MKAESPIKTVKSNGVPIAGGFKFSRAQKKKIQKVPVRGSASWGKCQLGEALVGGSAS